MRTLRNLSFLFLLATVVFANQTVLKASANGFWCPSECDYGEIDWGGGHVSIWCQCNYAETCPYTNFCSLFYQECPAGWCDSSWCNYQCELIQ